MLFPSQAKEAEEIKQPFITQGERSDCIISKFSPLLAFPYGNAASDKLYTEDCRNYKYRAQKRRLDEECETVQKSFFGTFDLAGHHLGNWLESSPAEKALEVLVDSY